jgi:nitrous oxidase accessory protein NosD
MRSSKALVIVVILALASVLTAIVYTRRMSVPRSPTIWYVGLPPLQFSSIQQAIDDAGVHDGDIIEVQEEGGPYYEHLVIDKSVTIRRYGQQHTPVIDGGGYGTAVNITAPNVVLSHLIIQNSQRGLHIFETSASNLINCTEIRGAFEQGLCICCSAYNTLRYNVLSENTLGFGVEGLPSNVTHFIQDIDSSNTVEGKPIYYWVNQHDKAVPSDAGYVAIVNSSNITVEELSLASNGQGVLVVSSTAIEVRDLEFIYPSIDCKCPIQLIATNGSSVHDVTIERGLPFSTTGAIELQHSHSNSITRNTLAARFTTLPGAAGIHLYEADSNYIAENVITKEVGEGYPIGVYLEGSNSNLIVGNTVATHVTGVPNYCPLALGSSNGTIVIHNNFLDAKNFILNASSYFTEWDNGFEGNYWGDYAGLDDGSGGRIAGDGVGDTALPHLGADSCPLIEPWSARRTFAPAEKAYVEKPDRSLLTHSNSTLASLILNRDYKRITLKATSGTAGFLNITIPRSWLDSPFEVRVDGEPVGYLYGADADYSSIYLTYSPGTRSIAITGTELGRILGDVDRDGDVDIFDVVLLAGNYGAHAPQEYPLVREP